MSENAHRRRFTDEEKEAMRRLRGEGLGYAEIARRTGRDVRRVKSWLRSAAPGCLLQTKPKMPPPPVIRSNYLRSPTLAQLMAGR